MKIEIELMDHYGAIDTANVPNNFKMAIDSLGRPKFEPADPVRLRIKSWRRFVPVLRRVKKVAIGYRWVINGNATGVIPFHDGAVYDNDARIDITPYIALTDVTVETALGEPAWDMPKAWKEWLPTQA